MISQKLKLYKNLKQIISQKLNTYFKLFFDPLCNSELWCWANRQNRAFDVAVVYLQKPENYIQDRKAKENITGKNMMSQLYISRNQRDIYKIEKRKSTGKNFKCYRLWCLPKIMLSRRMFNHYLDFVLRTCKTVFLTLPNHLASNHNRWCKKRDGRTNQRTRQF